MLAWWPLNRQHNWSPCFPSLITNKSGQTMSTVYHMPFRRNGTLQSRASLPLCAVIMPCRITSITEWKLRVVRPFLFRLLAEAFIALDRLRFRSGTYPNTRHANTSRRTGSINNDVVNDTGHNSMCPLLSIAVPSKNMMIGTNNWFGFVIKL